ncbi:MAG: cellulase family glycosylhydrolase [Bacteroidaceae bacterium]|nr:cellulase family glycosylhydrolase [Bacteroidaceae bacterium]
MIFSACSTNHKTVSGDKKYGKENKKSSFVTKDGTQFMREGKPYRYIGTNLWYASILASEGEGGNRERFCKEVDHLKSIGITNLRIATGPDAGSDLANPAKPYLQTAPGIFNDTILKGLDFAIAELEKRGMTAVIYLNNAWDWSGGFGFYLKQCGYGDSPNTNEDGGYNRYVEYCSNFAREPKALEMYYSYIKSIISRTNSITGRAYRDEPAIMSWQLCNEPRAFSKENMELLAKWIAKAAALIKSIDNNHLVSTGSEGYIGCEVDAELCERIHADKNIDYLTIHIWPVNWGWAPRSNPDSGIGNACTESGKYIDEHIAMAKRIDKPLVIEEFGYSRKNNISGVDIPTESRDIFYSFIFEQVKKSADEKGPIAGCNFWGWGGSGRPRDLIWKPGDDYLCDPPHEPQGWYSVFDCDTTTIDIIKKYAIEINK